jgi:hypothetical protein
LYADRSDLLAMHLPMKHFLVQSWQQDGEVPLWNPHVNCGMPFAHDVQVAAFYPPHLPLYWLPPDWLGAALSWLVVLHVMIAGWTMFAYATQQGLGRPAAFVAALGYMFAGKWMLHLLSGGHYPMIGLAWVPLVLLLLDQAQRRRSLADATLAGVVFGLVVIGAHPQVTFYAGLFIAVWTLQPTLEACGWLMGSRQGRPWRHELGRWLFYGGWTALLAACLAGVQLLPNLEVVPHTSRFFGIPSAEGLGVAVWKLTELVGPPLGEPTWENRGGFGVLWLAVAGMAFLLGPQRVRFYGAVALLLLLFSLGGSVFVDWLPGFRLFRLPARMLWLAAIPVSLLAGHTTQALLSATALTAAQRRRCRLVLLGVLLLAGGLTGLSALAVLRVEGSIRPEASIYWTITLVSVGVVFWILRSGQSLLSNRAMTGWIAVLLVDLWVLAGPLVAVRSMSEVYAAPACVQFLQAHGGTGSRVLDRDLPHRPGNTPLGYALPMMLGIEPVRGWHSLDVRWFKEYIEFIQDHPQPPGPCDLVENFPIRNKPLLDLLSVRYLLQPAHGRLLPGLDHAETGAWRKVADDPAPVAFGVTNSRGFQRYPAYSVYENPAVFPRAFLVPEARPLVARDGVLNQLKSTDFHRTVLLDGLPEPVIASALPEATVSHVRVLASQPNRVELHAEAAARCYLVLTDPWYPGWSCTVDGVPGPIYRANYLFRAVALEPGEHEIVFAMDPTSFRWGRWVTCAALAATIGILLATFPWVTRPRHAPAPSLVTAARLTLGEDEAPFSPRRAVVVPETMTCEPLPGKP